MRLLDRYIATQVIASTLLALAALLALFTFVAFVDDLDSVGKGDYTMAAAAQYLLLTLPRRAFLLFPLAALLGSLIGLGTLASNLELAVMRASGYSVAQIIAAVLKGGAVLMVAAVLIGELAAPPAERRAQLLRSSALDRTLAGGERGLWARDGQSYINIERALTGERIEGVRIYEFDGERRLRVVTRARAGRFDGRRWTLEDVRQTLIEPDRIRTRRLASAVWASGFEPRLVEVVAVKPESLSALGLIRYVAYLRANGLDASRFQLALWNKVIYPLATGVMIFLAVPLVLGRLGSAAMGVRVMIGVLVGIGFHVVNQASGQVGIVYGLSPFGSAVLPTAAFLAFGLWRLRRVA